jgi:hypothetical protein
MQGPLGTHAKQYESPRLSAGHAYRDPREADQMFAIHFPIFGPAVIALSFRRGPAPTVGASRMGAPNHTTPSHFAGCACFSSRMKTLLGGPTKHNAAPKCH